MPDTSSVFMGTELLMINVNYLTGESYCCRLAVLVPRMQIIWSIACDSEKLP